MSKQKSNMLYNKRIVPPNSGFSILSAASLMMSIHTSSSSSSSSGASDSDVSEVEVSDDPVVGSMPRQFVIMINISQCDAYHLSASMSDRFQTVLMIAITDTFPSWQSGRALPIHCLFRPR